MIVKLMTDRYGTLKAIKEEQEKWLEELLLFLGIDIHEEISSALFVEKLFRNKIEIIEHLDVNALQIKRQNELVGEWNTPKMTLKKDEGGYYYEIEIETWSIIEENINS